MSKQVSVRYFAVLREERGRDSESLTTDARTVLELYDSLRARHALSLPSHLVGAAVNGSLVRMDHALRDGDEVVFLPPVAGG